MRVYNIPLQLINLADDGFHLLVEITVFDQTKIAVLDTGASRTVFDKALLEGHQNEVTIHHDDHAEETQATTLFSTSSTVLVTFPKLKIGELKLKNYTAVGLDLKSVNATYAQLGHPEIACILGGDILQQYHAVINYKKLSLKLYR